MASVVSDPVKLGVSPLTFPEYVYVRVGFASPYTFDLFSAATDNVFLFIVIVAFPQSFVL